jgi:uncharacterized protein YbjT (DUF2867 family)
MPHTIAVIGSTGNTGRVIIQQLREKGLKVKAVARNPEKLVQLKTIGAEIYPGEIENTAFLAETFKGSG